MLKDVERIPSLHAFQVMRPSPLMFPQYCTIKHKSILEPKTDYAPDVSEQTHPVLGEMVQYAVNYYQDLVRPTLEYRAATDAEKQTISLLRDEIASQPIEATGEELQSCVYAAGKQASYENLRDWFGCLYETMLGQKQGPRMGGFFRLYGREKTLTLFDDVLNDRLAK